MAITVYTTNPDALLNAIKRGIDEKKIDTWSYDPEGDFTYTANQWIHKAWLKPIIEQGRLVFGLTGNRRRPTSVVVYGVYHGRFIEMLLSHFDTLFTDVSASSGGTKYDLIITDVG